jgi:hypothetical protein
MSSLRNPTSGIKRESSPFDSSSNSHLSSYEIGENAVLIRDAAKGIGRTLTIFENPRSIMIVSKAQEPDLILFTRELTRNLLDTPRCLKAGLKVYVRFYPI